MKPSLPSAPIVAVILVWWMLLGLCSGGCSSSGGGDSSPDVLVDVVMEVVLPGEVSDTAPGDLPEESVIFDLRATETDLQDAAEIRPEVAEIVDLALDRQELDGGAELDSGLDEWVDAVGDVDSVGDLVEIDVGPLESVAPMVINEFVVAPTTDEAIELFNRTVNPLEVTDWTLSVTSDLLRVWKLPETVVPGGGRLMLNAGNLVPQPGTLGALMPNAGALLVLRDEDGNLMDQVGYGTRGAAPLPSYGTSTARLVDGWDTDRDGWDFNWCVNPTMGEENDVPGVELEPVVISVSELCASSGERPAFLELRLLQAPVLDLSGWTLVLSGLGATGVLTLGDEMELVPGWFVLWEEDFPTYFQVAESGVAYLYDSQSRRRAQWGWTGLDPTGAYSSGLIGDTPASPACYNGATCGAAAMVPSPGEANSSGL